MAVMVVTMISTIVGLLQCGGPIISIVVVHLIGLDGKLGTREATNSKFGELSENSSKGRAVMNPNEGDVDDMTEQGADMLSLILGNSMSGEGDVAHAIQTGWLIKLELDRHAIICPDACLYLPQNIQVKEARYQVTKKHLEANVAEEAAAFVCEELRSAVAVNPAELKGGAMQTKICLHQQPMKLKLIGNVKPLSLIWIMKQKTPRTATEEEICWARNNLLRLPLLKFSCNFI
ncbi:uncharacterized protein LOC109533325 [Dendroctonus ponderosae]|uniref:Uncharacterized protein n=1 Tax=Dendroctonus ponderosae TaxID=77166 RepID=J3JU31_DENPD